MEELNTNPPFNRSRIFVVDGSGQNHRHFATLDGTNAAKLGKAESVEFQGPVATEFISNSAVLPSLALSALDLAKVAREDFGVELQFHLDLRNEYRLTMVIDSGAEEFLAAVKGRLSDGSLGYARHITDAELPMGYIADIFISIDRILSR